MNYKEFIKIFKKDYNLDYFYAISLKKKKEVKKILKREVDNEFLDFLFEYNIKKEEEIKAFFKLYNTELEIDYIYLCYIDKLIDLEDLKKIEDFNSFRYIILNKYKNYLKEDINKIDNVDLDNILFFIIDYVDFYKKINNNEYVGDIYLNVFDIKRDLNFLKILGIEKVKGDFSCDCNKNLKTLKGCPSLVGGNFNCNWCGLEKLGMPEGVRIKKDFSCIGNKNLKSLRGSPKWIGGSFNCNDCNLNEIDLDSGITIEKNLYCLEGNNVTKEQVEEYIRKNNIKLGGEIL